MSEHDTPLKLKREERGLSLIAMANETGISRCIINRIENAKQRPTSQQARVLFEYFDREIPLVNIYDPFFNEDRQEWTC